MKVGYRKPDLKKSIKARTTGKVKRKIKKSVNPFYGKKGMGYIKNPKRAINNKIYHKTTFGTTDVIRAVSAKGNDTAVYAPNSSSKYASEMNPITYFCLVFFLGTLGIHKFIEGSVGMGVLYLFTFGLFGIGWLIDVVKALLLLIESGNNFLNKDRLLQLQEIVMPDSPDHLVTTKQQLQSIARQQANDDIRIIQDSSKIIPTTTNPDVFFSRLELLKKHTYHLQLLEPFVPLTVSPSTVMNELLSNEQQIVKDLIIRYYNSVQNHANTLKTDKGKLNQYKKFYDTMSNYRNLISPENFSFVEQIFNQATTQLSAQY